MNITSKQKKTVLPMTVFLVSVASYFYLHGSILALLTVPSMAVSGGILAVRAAPAVFAWFDRDGWK